VNTLYNCVRLFTPYFIVEHLGVLNFKTVTAVSVSTNNAIYIFIYLFCGPGSVVGIATAYGLDGPGIEFRWGEIFRTSPDRL